MTHSTAYTIELPGGERFVVVRIPAGEFSLHFDEAASLHEGLSMALSRLLDPLPLEEAEPSIPYRPRRVEAFSPPSSRRTTLDELA